MYEKLEEPLSFEELCGKAMVYFKVDKCAESIKCKCLFFFYILPPNLAMNLIEYIE